MQPNVLRFILAVLLVAGSGLRAQQADSTARALQESPVQRARKLLEDGNVADGRRILDSILKVTSPDAPVYADALYWRAAGASAAVDAERDYRRLLIEAPLSLRAEDAMLQLAQLEQARGDRRGASDHLQRFLLTYPNNPARPRAAVSLVRLLFEQGQVARGCEALRTGREAMPAENAELRNQLEFYAPRCVVLEAPPDAARDSVADARDSSRNLPKPATAPRSTATSESASFYSVQVAAYDSREPASRMARMLVSRGLEARVDGKARPFRVRVGRYTTRAQAVNAAEKLKSQGIGGFVTLVKSGG